MIFITVTGVETAENAKGRFTFSVSITSGEHEEKNEITVFRYFLKKEPFSGSIPQAGDSLSSEKYEALLAAGEATAATVKAVGLLAYGDQTAKKLREKLHQKKFSKEAAASAVEFCVEKRYIREDEQLKRLMELLCEKKKYGIRRIKQEVYVKGFSEDAVKSVWEDTLETLDFDAALDSRMEKLGFSAFETPEKQKKTTASLLRYGFTQDEILRAYKRLKNS
ncbi:MAG: RecX family transcriptional regulator [Clostridia bacterium]|nr:RecX family transcriptional regulator [Clostridia bacterium]